MRYAFTALHLIQSPSRRRGDRLKYVVSFLLSVLTGKTPGALF